MPPPPSWLMALLTPADVASFPTYLVFALKVVVDGNMNHGQNEEEDRKQVVAYTVEVMLS